MAFNKKFLLAGAALSGVILGGVFFGAKVQAATTNLTIDAVIVQAVTVACGTNLDFGQIDATASDIITVDTADGRTEASGADNLVGGSTAVSGVCTIDAADGANLDVNIADTTLTGGGSTLEVSNYTFAGTGAAGAAGNNFTITGLPAGAGTNYTVGADLNIVAGDLAGTYQGTAVVTVTYQ